MHNRDTQNSITRRTIIAGSGYLSTPVCREIFAADVPAGLSTPQQPSGEPAWQTIPSWTPVATRDQVIAVAAQGYMARRARAKGSG
jgi:hypothetical protein